ncbi:nucleoside/nucleotide kinase family protein [Streptomyces pseudovenezuelae]|uniref:Pantothenate kinase n=1 Tax=Streptomyces pseudovenezuelae TaxID=67350 RepID=A0ABT6LTM5_9ACTN|nr:nucleoside/nucleotide kinase family protein [Streptomyces pseudovenezuelae]MDH6219665.1 pantothenate kinase [Streptomyces pseudovenezuelae]
MTITGSNRTDGETDPRGTPLYGNPSLDILTQRALHLARDGRALLGIVGEPGAGKSTFAEQLLARLEKARPGLAVAVSMDGFHLAHKVIGARGQSARKGTIDTFDADGFLAFLRRTRDETANTVWWPEFDRELEDAVSGATEVTTHHRLVIVDGNFLLATQDPWRQAKNLLAETWFLDARPEPRRERLTRRYISYGFTPETARAKTLGVDEDTSALIRSTVSRADLVLSELG